MCLFAKLQTNTMLLPSDAGNPGTMIAQALQIYNHTYKQKLTLGSPGPSKRAEEADLSLGMPSVSDLGTFQHLKLSIEWGFFFYFSFSVREE